MSSESRSSLYCNGRVYTRRDLEGSDSNWVGVNFQEYEVRVEDGRSNDMATLEKHGFELIANDIEKLEIDFFNNDTVVGKYYPLCEETVKDATGAQVVYAFDHNIRSAVGKKTKKDIKKGKATLISLLGYKNTVKYRDKIKLNIFKKINKFGKKAGDLRNTVNFILERSK